MADFCRSCTIKNFGPTKADENDMLRPELTDDEFIPDLCEGCGPGYFDRRGQRVLRIGKAFDGEHHWSASAGAWVEGAPVG